MTAPAPSRLQLWLLALATAAVGVAHGLRVQADPDLWWHVRSGELILAERAIPRTDPFSFTTFETAWTNHEWLSEVIFSTAFRAGGGAGLTLLRLAWVAAAGGLLAWLLTRRSRLPIVAAAILAAYLPFFWGLLNLRPHSFTYVLTLVILAILELAAKRPGALFLLPLLLGLWANLHGGFLLGAATVVLGVVAHSTGLEWSPRDFARPSARVWVLLGLAALAPLATPYGWKMALYLWQELGSDHPTVSEWKRLNEIPALWPTYLGLTLPPLAVLLLAPRRARLTEAAFFLASVPLAYRHVRFLALLGIFGSLVLATGVGAWWESRERGSAESRSHWLGGTSALAVLTALLVLWGSGRWLADWQRKGLALEVDPRIAPVLATRFLADHDLGPNLATRLDWGGYAIFHLWPRYRVSIDGRNVTVYPQPFVADQIAAYDRGEPLAGLRGARVDVALVESAGPGFEGMQREPGWVMVFRDPLSAVFVPRQRAERLARSQPRGGPYEFTERVPTFP